ncbi:hypothetical protein Q1695_000428 [Nippostrongylus brasiliensis]|nr:hypothetical protein Q1695_000428 [Nippostrongylus brasiliensis]
MSYTSRYSSSYSGRYGGDSSSRYGGTSDSTSRYSSDISSRYGDSTRDYTSSRLGDYSSRYRSKDLTTGDDDYSTSSRGSYSSRYRSKAYDEPDDSEITTQPRADAYEHDYSMGKEDNTVTEEIAEKTEEEQEEQEEVHETALHLTEDNIEVANVEEEEPIAEPQEEEQVEFCFNFLFFSIDEVDDAPSRRPYASTLSSSSAKHEDVEEVEEVPKTTVQQREGRENKIAFKAPTEDSSEPRRIKSPIENIVPKKRVSDLIARFNAGDAGRGDAWKNKDESGGGKSVGKLQPTVFH